MMDSVEFVGLIRDRANLTGMNFRGIDLSGMNFDALDLSNCDFTNANLHDTTFYDCRFIGANLSDANCEGATFNNCDFTDADMIECMCGGVEAASDTTFRGTKGIVDAGRDPRGYRFIGVWYDGQWMVAAGCRWFTQQQAELHWGPTNKCNEDAMDRVAVIMETRSPIIPDQE